LKYKRTSEKGFMVIKKMACAKELLRAKCNMKLGVAKNIKKER